MRAPVARDRGRAASLGVLCVLAVSCLAGFLGLARARFEYDEAMWILQGEKVWSLLCRGDWSSPAWGDSDSSWGYQNPPVAKYVIGGALAAQGVSWEWARGEKPADSVLVAARRPSVIFAMLGCLGLFAVGTRALTLPAAFLGALCLAMSPRWLAASRLAMTDIYGAALAVLAMAAFAAALRELSARGRARVLGASTLACAVLAGLAAGAKLNAAATPCATGVFLLLLCAREALTAGPCRGLRTLRITLLGVLFAAASCATFVLVNPYLHQSTWERFTGMLTWFRSTFEEWARLAEAGRFAGAFRPGPESAKLAFGLLVFPVRYVLLLALPMVVTVILRRRRPTASAPEAARLLGWAILIAVTTAVGLAKNIVAHPWMVWLGILGSGVVWAGRSRADRPDRSRAYVAAAVLVWGLVTAFFTWRAVYRPTPRYYLPIIPPLCVLAGFALGALREDLARARTVRATQLFDAAVLFSALSVLAACPDYERAAAGAMFRLGALDAGRVLHWLSVASLTAAVATAGWYTARPEVAARGAPRADSEAPIANRRVRA